MKRFSRRRAIYVQRRFFVSFFILLFALALAVPALAEFLGPDRTTSQFVTVRDPDKDVWTITRNPSSVVGPSYCLIIHTCDEHPSVVRQMAVCGWDMGGVNSGCDMAYKTEEQTVTLPEATIADDLQNCNLNSGWCTSSPTLHLSANEPLPGESIILIEGTRNGVAFACTSDSCDVPLAEGSNSFSFWALSSYGDGSQMGNHSAQVDTVPPSSAFGSPPEGSSVWVSGVLDMSGSSSDASSGLASAEISLNGGGSWQGLSLSGGGWGYSWDTSAVPDGSYLVLVRAQDFAGHLESTASITVHVDLTPPSADLPDEWFIWEPVAIGASDGGSGVKEAELTIHGGSFGNRKYEWSGGSIPGSFLWDRYFGSIVAPIGEYKVTLKVWDQLGHSDSASGKVLIPAPPTSAPEPPSIPPTDPPPTTTPLPTLDSETASVIIVSTATAKPAAAGSGAGSGGGPAAAGSGAGSGGGPAAAPMDESAPPSSFIDPGATLPSSGSSSGLLWGTAALSAAAAATAYALSRRKARELEIERMRAQIAAESSPAAFESRLQRLRKAGAARAAQILSTPKNAYLQAVAAAAGAAKVAKDLFDQRRTDIVESVGYAGRTDVHEATLVPSSSNLTTWTAPSPELIDAYRIGTLHTIMNGGQTLSLGSGTPPANPDPRISQPTSEGTPVPSPDPSRAPHPPGFTPVEDQPLSPAVVTLLGRGSKLVRGIYNVARASNLQYAALDTGLISVSAPGIQAGAKADFITNTMNIPGRAYRPETLAGVTSANLMRNAVSKLGLGIPYGVAIGTNIYNYGFGEYRSTGLRSNEFAASTLVDMGVAGTSGILAAAGTGIVVAALAAAGVVLAPVAVVAAVVVLGVGAGIALSAAAQNMQLKDRVANGLSAWGGVYENGRTIAAHIGGQVSQKVGDAVDTVSSAISSTATAVSGGITRVSEVVRDPIGTASAIVRGATSAASSLVGGAKDAIGGAGKAISSAASDAANAARNFIGGLFGGNS